MVVNGTVELNSATLELPNAVPQFALRKDDTFALIVNDGTDAVSGRFTYEGTLLEEGMIIPNFLGSGKGALITYFGNVDGGSVGNDVLLIIINTPPVAVDDETSTSEDESVTFNVLSNDTDLEDNILPNLTVNLSSPSLGTLTNNHDGTFVFDPNGAFEGLAIGESATVSFEYQVTDEYNESDTGVVTITVIGVNDAPTVGVQHADVTISEGQTATNSGTFADIDLSDRPTITASIGTITQDDSNSGAWTWSFDSNDGPGQTQQVTITVDDHNGGINRTTFDLLVNNVAPTLVLNAVTAIVENGVATLTGTITDPGTQDTFTLTINWGDPLSPKNVETYTFAASATGTQSFTLTHQYLDDNVTGTAFDTYTISASVQDKDLAVGTATTTVTVNNVAPTLVLNAVTAIVENGVATLTGTITDPGTQDTFTLTINWGDPLSPKNVETYTFAASATGTQSFTLTHQYLDDNVTGTAFDTYTISASVQDKDLAVGTATTTVIVNNVAPTLVLNAVTDIDENGIATLSGTITDPGTLDTFTLVIDWNALGNIGGAGEGTTTLTHADLINVAPGVWTFTATHQYLDDNATGTASDRYTISVRVTDDDSGTAIDSVNFVVSNVAPVITVASTDAASLLTRSGDKTVVLNGTFTDVGSLDTHKAIVDWGDGTPSVEVTVNAANRTFTGSHTYATGGIFQVTVTVIDDDGGTVVSTTHAVVEGVGVVNGTLYIIGTDGRDHVKLKQDDKKGTLKVNVKLNQGGSDADHIKETFVASTINRVVAFLFDGDDHYDGRSAAIPQMVFGGNGDDHISGGRGNDALFGGAGNDHISGGLGADILVGGTGKDKIKGGDGNDLLIGGSLVNDFNDLSIIDAIDSAMAQWATGDLADTFSFLGTIIDDDEKDDLFGEKGNDTIYGGKGDKVKQ